MKTAQILIAHEREGMEVLTDALQGYNLVTVTDAQAAQYQVMEDGIDLFLIGIHFDESRAVELVSFIRQDNKHKSTPIIVLRMLPSKVADFLRSTTDSLIKIGTISQYLEVEGDPEVAAKIRNAVNEALPNEKALGR